MGAIELEISQGLIIKRFTKELSNNDVVLDIGPSWAIAKILGRPNTESFRLTFKCHGQSSFVDFSREAIEDYPSGTGNADKLIDRAVKHCIELDEINQKL